MVDGRLVEAVIIDRHEVFRRGLKDLLEETGEFVVVGEGGSVADARRLLASEHPDVATIDADLPDGDGLQLVRERTAADRSEVWLVIGANATDRARLSAALVGAAGFVDKEDGAAEIVETIRAAAHGPPLFTEEVVESLLTTLSEEPHDDELVTLDELTPQETRVFELVGRGLSNREVAEQLSLTEKTVKNYVSKVLEKLGMSRRTEVAVLATRLAVRHEPRDDGPP